LLNWEKIGTDEEDKILMILEYRLELKYIQEDGPLDLDWK